VTVVTDVFQDLGKEVAQALGAPAIRMSVIAHPLGELKRAAVHERSARAFPDIMGKLLAARQQSSKAVASAQAKIIKVRGSWQDLDDHCYRQGWTDGLPVVPPLPDSVKKMLAASALAPDTVIGVVAPRMGLATVEKIATNAVMAGCRPEHFRVVLAAVRAVCAPQFNLLPMQATTNPVTPMIIVNGPIVQQLQLNSGYNVLGQGWRSNATIGRALRFVLGNIGGAVPGKVDKACHGQPGKLSFCIAEDEAANPWQPLHVERGFAADTSTVSVIGVTGTQDIIHYARTSAQQIVDTIIRAIPREGHKNLYSGGEPMLILGPEQAAILGREKISKEALKRKVFEGTRVELATLDPHTVALIKSRRAAHFPAGRKTTRIPIADRPQDIQILVAGGAGNHSVFLPTWGDTRCVTLPI
jgi:hypothetical protein